LIPRKWIYCPARPRFCQGFGFDIANVLGQ
jgi:hypothetical protein